MINAALIGVIASGFRADTGPAELTAYTLTATGTTIGSTTGCGYAATWNTSENNGKGITSVIWQRDTSPDFSGAYEVTEDADAGGTSLQNASCGITFYFRVRAERNGELGPWSNIDSATTGDINS